MWEAWFRDFVIYPLTSDTKDDIKVLYQDHFSGHYQEIRWSKIMFWGNF